MYSCAYLSETGFGVEKNHGKPCHLMTYSHWIITFLGAGGKEMIPVRVVEDGELIDFLAHGRSLDAPRRRRSSTTSEVKGWRVDAYLASTLDPG